MLLVIIKDIAMELYNHEEMLEKCKINFVEEDISFIQACSGVKSKEIDKELLLDLEFKMHAQNYFKLLQANE